MSLVTSFQAFARVASVVILTIWCLQRQVFCQRTTETEVEYDLEVEVMSNTSEQKDTSDDDEPEDVYANEPSEDEN